MRLKVDSLEQEVSPARYPIVKPHLYDGEEDSGVSGYVSILTIFVRFAALQLNVRPGLYTVIRHKLFLTHPAVTNRNYSTNNSQSHASAGWTQPPGALETARTVAQPY